MTKIVYLFDEVTGQYICEYFAQESPLEKGKYIEPVCSTDIQPPTFNESQTCKFRSGRWVVEDKPLPEPEIIPEPVNSIPSIISMRQARLALLQAGLLASVNLAISSGSEADKIEWEYAADVDRNSPLVQNMKAGLSLSDADLDNLFTLAASL